MGYTEEEVSMVDTGMRAEAIRQATSHTSRPGSESVWPRSEARARGPAKETWPDAYVHMSPS
eukprot:CAMPEP_0119265050 /NCGR_PEP_ID=MMETSP1329-20130426/3968_1 /TAXON_ID=114041 /ORGANISM="Genus nov. species nov., Strain RCC1024" /LENGTH=61 /DNA_ID=CAMNT_0007264855 /DNA_START=29 /DNA_END=211 /DNA_ORIENTATION=+